MKENNIIKDIKLEDKKNNNNENLNDIKLNKRKHKTGKRVFSSLSKAEFSENEIELDKIRKKYRNNTSKYNKKKIRFQLSPNNDYSSSKRIKRNNSNISSEKKDKGNDEIIKNNNFNTLFYNNNKRSNSNIINKPQNEIDIKKILENYYIKKKIKKKSMVCLYTKHYGDRNKCPMCQSIDMKAKYIENKIGLYKKHICKDKEYINDNINFLQNFSVSKRNFFPNIKNNEDYKNNNIIMKNDLTNINKDKLCIYNLKNKINFNIHKDRLKKMRHKFSINDFPVLNNYFNS